MDSIETPSSSPGRSGRIEEAVAREMKRSQRLLWFYSLLLVIPLGACAVYYQYGRTDAALVHSEVNNNIGPIKQALDQAQPALAQVRQTAAQLSAQEKRLQSLSQQQEALATTVQVVPEKLQQIDGVRTDVSAVKADMEAIQAQSQELRGSLKSTGAAVDRLYSRFTSVEQQQARVERDLKDLSTRIEKVPRANADDQLRRQQEVIDNLQKRIQKLEQLRVNPRADRPQ